MTNFNKQIKYWPESAEKNWQVAQSLFRNKHYDACLFFVHLSIEKLIKGLVVIETKKPAPYIHDLPKLANLAKLELSQEKRNHLRIITTFNIAGRYADDKYDFYKKCTKNYTQKNLFMCKEIFLWLKKEYPKK